MKTIKMFMLAALGAMTLAACKKEEPVLDVSVPAINIMADGNTFTVDVHSNLAWNASTTADWLTITEGTGTGDGEFSVTCDPNVGPEGENAPEREGVILITAGGLNCEIAVKQYEESPVLELQGNVLKDVAKEGETFMVNLNVNIPYQVICEYDWVKVTSTKAVKTDKYQIVVEPNRNYTMRSASVIFMNEDYQQTISITQDGRSISELTAINDSTDFRAFAEHQNAFVGKTIKLAADITITLDQAVDTLLCDFDGQNKTITLNHTETEAHRAMKFGVFRNVGKEVTVSNLKTRVSFTAAEGAAFQEAFVGGVAGQALEGAKASNCDVEIYFNGTTNSSAARVGGVFGNTLDGVVVEKCSVWNATIINTATSTTADQFAGIIGHSNGSVTVTDSGAYCQIEYLGKSNPRAAGIIGYTQDTKNLLIKNCQAEGSIHCQPSSLKDQYNYLGGITAYNNTFAIADPTYVIEGCTSKMDIVADCDTDQFDDASKKTWKVRMGGILPHMPKKSGSNPSVLTVKGCTFMGALTNKMIQNPGLTTITVQQGGIVAFVEADCAPVVEDCTVSGIFTCSGDYADKSPVVGGVIGSVSNVNTKVQNAIIRFMTRFEGPDTYTKGLIAAAPGAYTTQVTANVDGATIITGTTVTKVDASNYTSFLFGNTKITDLTGVSFSE